MEDRKLNELNDEALDKVAGGYSVGYSYNGPKLQCSNCLNMFYPENTRQEINKICPTCDDNRRFAKRGH